ncbi:MAG: isoleucine--tRNA ligase [Pirellulales bacterium]|nr:isoleucine--tRNA ligase [Pirellulales bacterium]
MFSPVANNVSFPKLEEQIIAFWNAEGIYEKSLAAREQCPPFIFYEGPPTANGLPHPGHCLTRAIKDLFPRYKTMRGHFCERKAGWDTHGLPVEVEVCKELGIHSKEEIEAYGVEPFIRKCLESVFRYTKQWEGMTERLGFWIHLDEAYVTFHQSYVESVWWALKNLFDRGLLYQGYKIVWWWAQGGTALSSGEVGQGYREVADPSVYVRFPLVEGSGFRVQDLGTGNSQSPIPNPRSLFQDTDLLVWTTTPWTLPGNQFAAVKPDLEYSVVEFEGEQRKLILASALVEAVAAKVKKEARVIATLPGKKMLGLRYRPPFDYYYKTQGQKEGKLKDGGRQALAWRVVPAEFVTVDTGTGVVHQAPAFGEVDFELLQTEQARFAPGEGPPLLCNVAPDGTFTKEVPDYHGRWVKEADGDIIRELRGRGLLFHREDYHHDYPFCWRAEEDPLIQYPRKSWFIRTTQFKEQMLANNSRINWLPEHIRDGRFGNFLETNVDWALSRERYWGTPLPIWVCEKTGYAEAVAIYDELLKKPGVKGTEVWQKAKKESPELAEDLKVHKPYIDAITYDSPKAAGARMRRVPEVIDCWFDSGAMPFAQWGFPGEPDSKEKFSTQFPADFISEALDQTRGWFYSLLAISTLLFGEDSGVRDQGSEKSNPQSPIPNPFPHPYRNCIVLGLMLGEDGGKMSKSKRNYREPDEIFDRYGADALRWYFFSNQPPWTSIRYSEQAIKDCIPEFLLRLWNVYSFFVIYANIDKFDPAAAITQPAGQLTAEVLASAKKYRPVEKRAELDRWVLSELNRTAAAVVERMDAYDNFSACQRLSEFVDALSNWYVRRSRNRFWSGGHSTDKTDAYWTLYECLLTTCKLVAPFVPFLAEHLWQNLAVAAFAAKPEAQRSAESVHLCDYPCGVPEAVDETLSARMALVREIVSLGRSARMGAKLKVRQPLGRVEVVLADPTHLAWLQEHDALICDELNVKRVEFIQKADQYITYTVLPDLKRLGPRLGKRLPAVRKLLAEADAGALLAELETAGKLIFRLPDGEAALSAEDVQIRLAAKEGWAAAQGRNCVVVLSTELTPELVLEGLAREEVRVIQDRRKELNLHYTDRIELAIETQSQELSSANTANTDYICGETLALNLSDLPLPGVEPVAMKIGDYQASLYLKVVPKK